MDIEKTVASWLHGRIGVPAYLDVPSDAPDLFLTVTLTGGGTEGGFGNGVALDVDCYAQPGHRVAAMSLAEQVRATVPDLDELPELFAPTVTNQYREYDPDGDRARYVVSVEATTY